MGAGPEGLEDGSPPVRSRGKTPVGGLGTSPPEDEKISVHFLAFSCIKFCI